MTENIGERIYDLETEAPQETQRLQKLILTERLSLKRLTEDYERSKKEKDYLEDLIQNMDKEIDHLSHTFELTTLTIETLFRTKSLLEKELGELSKSTDDFKLKSKNMKNRLDAETDKYRAKWQEAHTKYENIPKAVVLRKAKGKLIHLEELLHEAEIRLEKTSKEVRLKCERNQSSAKDGIMNLNNFIIEVAKSKLTNDRIKKETTILFNDIEKLNNIIEEKNLDLMRKQHEIDIAQKTNIPRSQPINIPKPSSNSQTFPGMQLPRFQLFIPTFIKSKVRVTEPRVITPVNSSVSNTNLNLTLDVSNVPTETSDMETESTSTECVNQKVDLQLEFNVKQAEIPPASPPEIFLTPQPIPKNVMVKEPFSNPLLETPTVPNQSLQNVSNASSPIHVFSPRQHANFLASLTGTPDFTIGARKMFETTIQTIISPAGRDMEIQPGYFQPADNGVQNENNSETPPSAEIVTKESNHVYDTCPNNMGEYESSKVSSEMYSKYFQEPEKMAEGSPIKTSRADPAQSFYSPEVNWGASTSAQVATSPKLPFGTEQEAATGDFGFGFSISEAKSPPSNNPFGFFGEADMGGGDCTFGFGGGNETAKSPPSEGGFTFQFC